MSTSERSDAARSNSTRGSIVSEWMLPMRTTDRHAHYMPVEVAADERLAAAACGRLFDPAFAIIAPLWSLKCGVCVDALVRQIDTPVVSDITTTK